MPKAIHYKHPKFSDRYHACGMGNPDLNYITDELERVTCKSCLKTTPAKKRSPGRPPQGDKAKQGKYFKLSPDLLERLAQEQNQNAAVETALRQYFGM